MRCEIATKQKNHYFIGLNTTCFCLNWNQLWIEKCPKRLQVNGYWLALGNRLKIDKIPYQIGMMSQQPYCAYQFLCSLSPSSLSELFFSGNRFDRVPCFWKQEKAKENAILLNINDQISTTFFLINSSSSKFLKQWSFRYVHSERWLVCCVLTSCVNISMNIKHVARLGDGASS